MYCYQISKLKLYFYKIKFSVHRFIFQEGFLKNKNYGIDQLTLSKSGFQFSSDKINWMDH